MNLLKILKLGIVPIAMCLATATLVKPSQAAVSVVVTHTGDTTVDAGEDLNVVFAADVRGKPVENSECQIDDLVYTWTITVTGPSGSVVTHPTGPTATATATAASGASYTVSASCTVTYSQTECGPDSTGSQAGSDSTSVSVNPEVCVQEDPAYPIDPGQVPVMP